MVRVGVGVKVGVRVGVIRRRGGLWHYIYELFIDILRIGGVVAFEFFSRSVARVSDVDVPRVIAVAEDFVEGDGVSAGGSAPQRR